MRSWTSPGGTVISSSSASSTGARGPPTRPPGRDCATADAATCSVDRAPSSRLSDRPRRRRGRRPPPPRRASARAWRRASRRCARSGPARSRTSATATRSTSTSRATARARRQHVRMTGFNAMEQTVYSSIASRRRGECHALEATSRLEQLIRAQPLAGPARGPEPGEPLAPAPAARDRGADRRPLARRRHDHARRGPRAVARRTARSGRGTPATARSPSRRRRSRSASGARPTAGWDRATPRRCA